MIIPGAEYRQAVNERGSAMVLSLVVVSIVTFGLIGMFRLTDSIEAGLQHLRWRSHIGNVEVAIRMILSNPISYTCTHAPQESGGYRITCGVTGQQGGTGFISARQQIDRLLGPLPGHVCENGSSCGLRMTETPHFVSETGSNRPLVRTTLDIAMVNLPFKPLEINVEPPLELLQQFGLYCNGIFTGFKPDGTLICHSTSARAPAGSYISAINPATLAVTISRLPTAVMDCAGITDSYLSQYQWQGEGRYGFRCDRRVDPFSLGGRR